MCGVAQEATPEDGVKAYTSPWHVTVATGTVRALQALLSLVKFWASPTHSLLSCSLRPALGPS